MAPRFPNITVFVAVILVFSTIPKCHALEAPPKEFTALEDLDDRTIGILVGTMLDLAVEKHLGYAVIRYYDDYEHMEQDLLAGKIDAVIGGGWFPALGRAGST